MNTTVQTETKVRTFEENVAIVRKGLTTFVAMGIALKQIRDLKQYEKKYGTGQGWTSCLKAEFGMTTQYAGQLIAASEVVARLKTETTVSVLPTNEQQVRALRKAPEAKQPETWNDAVKDAKSNGKNEPTAKEVANNVKLKVLPKAEQREVKKKATVNGKVDANKLDNIVGMNPGNKEYNLKRDARIEKNAKKAANEQSEDERIKKESEARKSNSTLVNFREEFTDDWKSIVGYYSKFSYKQLQEIAIDVINKSK